MILIPVEIIGTFALILAVLGAIFNARKFRVGFIIWMVSNILCAIIHTSTGVLTLLLKDFIFFVLCIDGYFRWGRKNK